MPGGISKPLKGADSLRTTVLRGFTGGLNVVDDDMNLPYKYATVMRNCFVTPDGGVQVRYGTSLFAATAEHFSLAAVGIVNIEYFNDSLIVVGTNGEILRVLADGSVSRIWDATIASSLPDAPSGWSATTFASFAQFNGHLIICNGVDKPLDIDADFFVEYLQDAATNTNINVPICRYVVACQRYLVMAGDPLFPSRVHISARDAAGTWFGDPPPNDATFVDVGSVVAGATTIRGLLPFRNRLLVLFVEGIVIGEFGAYNEEGDHTPSFDDGIKGFGSVSHRAAFAEGDDGLMMDMNGVPSLKRTVFSGLLKPEYISEFIDPLITAANRVHSLENLEDHVFSVYDKFEGQQFFFVPNEDYSERTVFVYGKANDAREGWSTFSGWNFTCATRSLSGRIFFGDADGNIWLYGCRDAVTTTDFIDTVTLESDADGTPFTYEWFMPWTDLGNGGRGKSSKYISFDTRGIGEFTVEMYVDGFTTASLALDMSMGDQGAYGSGPQPFGSGRITSFKKLHGWPCKFEKMRLRFVGTTEDAPVVDKFLSITLHYLLGSIRL
jgi:hypothetical protein